MTRAWTACLLGLAACGDVRPSAESEVAAELRALRAVLVQRAAEPVAVRSLDSTQFAAVLAPLREVLDGLVRQQAELQQRQLSLTQEMQRWSQLLVESTGSAGREEGKALTARLQQLEAALQQQQTRSENTEKLLQDALDRTADRLEEFLKRVGADGAAVPASTSPAPLPAPSNTSPDTPPPKSIGDASRPRRAASSSSWWWGAVVVVGTCCGFVCFRRWRQRLARTGSSSPLLSPAKPAPPDEGVQEIWAAAALLGEAVGRLRESTTAPPDGNQESSDPAASAARESELGEFIVLDDELLQPLQHAPIDGPLPLATKPVATVCNVRTDDAARATERALQFLATDCRVLRRPEPTVRRGPGGLEIAFRAVPGLPPGEQSHLEQSLRDACR